MMESKKTKPNQIYIIISNLSLSFTGSLNCSTPLFLHFFPPSISPCKIPCFFLGLFYNLSFLLRLPWMHWWCFSSPSGSRLLAEWWRSLRRRWRWGMFRRLKMRWISGFIMDSRLKLLRTPLMARATFSFRFFFFLFFLFSICNFWKGFSYSKYP